MEVESVPYSAFQTLTSCRHVAHDPDNHGCQWYLSRDRRIAGRVYLDAKHEDFRFSVLNRIASGWDIYEPRKSFEQFTDAERALKEEMLASSGVKPLSHTDATPRLKWGRGRTKRSDSLDAAE